MELVTFVPLYSMPMPWFISTVIEAPFVLTLVNTIVGIRFKPHFPKGIKFVNLHQDMPQEVNIVFAN
jgi:hypothetical protein